MDLKLGYLLVLLIVSVARSDDIDRRSRGSMLIKAMKEMSSKNDTKVDSLNLPANASSIRQNITDTFSCENRTYGYYADVDNDCQIFHVCLPSQTPGGRNVTYRWSFICPNETMFNQVVLTCTRPMDSIPCEESPMYYYLNDDIGKINKTEEKPKDKRLRKSQKIKEVKRKENIIMQTLLNNINTDELRNKLEDIEFGGKDFEETPMLLEAVIDNVEPEDINVEEVQEEEYNQEELDRVVMERNIGSYRQMKRGGFRFKSDV